MKARFGEDKDFNSLHGTLKDLLSRPDPKTNEKGTYDPDELTARAAIGKDLMLRGVTNSGTDAAHMVYAAPIITPAMAIKQAEKQADAIEQGGGKQGWIGSAWRGGNAGDLLVDGKPVSRKEFVDHQAGIIYKAGREKFDAWMDQFPTAPAQGAGRERAGAAPGMERQPADSTLGPRPGASNKPKWNGDEAQLKAGMDLLAKTPTDKVRREQFAAIFGADNLKKFDEARAPAAKKADEAPPAGVSQAARLEPPKLTPEERRRRRAAQIDEDKKDTAPHESALSDLVDTASKGVSGFREGFSKGYGKQ